MKRNTWWGVAVLALAAGQTWGTDVNQEIDVFFQRKWQSTPGGGPAHKFNEYRTVPDGLVVERYEVSASSEAYGLFCEAQKPGYDDQAFSCEGGKPGLFTYRFGWDQIPHVYSNQARTLYVDSGGGRLTLSDELQRDMQNDPGRFVSVSSGMASFLDGAAWVPLETRDDKGNLDLRWRPAEDLTVTLEASRWHKSGSRPMGAAFGFSNHVEVAEPVDYVTHEASFGAEYARPDKQLAFRYSVSDFHNQVPVLQWDNPRRLDDRYVSASAYSAGDGSALGQMALAPDNTMHAFNFSGGVQLPWETQFSAEAGWSYMLAYNDMLPYTTNGAINAGAAGVIAGTFNDPPFDASDPKNLPSRKVTSKINAYTQFYKLTNRALDRLKTTVSYRSYQQDNISDLYEFPGYVRLDQVWEGEALRNERHSWRKESADLKFDYEVTKSVSMSADAGVDWEKRTREVSKSREYKAGGSAVYRPTQKTLVNLSYLLALRRMNGFDNQSYRNESQQYIELPGLIRFDVADRNRNRGRLQVQHNFTDDAYVSLSGQVTYDGYRPGKVGLNGGNPTYIEQQYGLLDQRDMTAGVDFGFPLNGDWGVEAYYEYDYSRRIIRSNVTNASPPVTQNAVEDWTARTGETSNIGGVEVAWRPTDKAKTTVGYELVYSFLRQDPIRLGSAAAVAGYKSLPVTKRMFQALKVTQGYQLAKSLRLVGRYVYEKFDVSDFAADNVLLKTSDAIYLGASLRGYSAHTASLGVNYSF